MIMVGPTNNASVNSLIFLGGSWIGTIITSLTLSSVAGAFSIVLSILGIINFFYPIKKTKKDSRE